MLRFSGTFLAVLMALTLVGCGDSPEAVFDDAVGLMEEMNEVLAEVDDVASAEAAAERIKDLAEELREIGERADALEEPDEATLEALRERYEPLLEEQMDALKQNMIRIGLKGEEVAAPIIAAFEELDEVGRDSQPEWFR